MRFQTPLEQGTLLKRYKRFLADIRLPDGREVTAHCANPGAMTGVADPGSKVWIEANDDPRKKLKYAWRLVEHPDGNFTGVATLLANRIVKEALERDLIDGLAGYDTIRPEVKYGQASRIDFVLRGSGRRDAYVEVKSVTLSRKPGVAEFPDSVTIRGTRHLEEMAAMARSGQRAVTLYLVQRTDCHEMRLARDIDSAYARAFAEARRAGVEVMTFAALISPSEISLGGRLDFIRED
ncbi:MAG: DNA/RNA nuclease SfsA [Roseovarius sp.]|nr:DNA/RNA nuclease SfsA [Roseovarius sp.]